MPKHNNRYAPGSPTWPIPPETGTPHRLKLFGGDVAYWEYNPGRPTTIVMVHGFRGTHDGLAEIIAGLDDYHIIAPDLPPFGDSLAMTERPHTTEGATDLMLALIDRLQLTNLVLFGHSMGGVVVAEMLKRRPGLARAVILLSPIIAQPMRGLNTLKLLPGKIYFWLGTKALPEQGSRKFMHSAWPIIVTSVAFTKTKDRQLRRRISDRHVIGFRRYNSTAALREAYVSSTGDTMGERSRYLTIPTLIITGQNDGLVNTRDARKFAAQLPHATLAEVSGSGHLLHYELPDEVSRLVRDYLERTL
ncbi:MAG TPA: alpha/beta hydrolase [Candidatus Saccharimonadia bacterium]